jgi:ribonuclease D
MWSEAITKEEIQELPLLRFTGNIHVVENYENAVGAFRHLEKFEYLGFDTEKKPTFVRGQYHPTAMVQLSTREDAFLFRLNKIGMHSLLKEILENDKIIKVGISLKDDLADLRKMSKINPAGYRDLNNIAGELGIQQIGVRSLAGIILQQRVSKNQQTSNWENDVLTEPQKNYAALDAWVCAEMYYQLLYKGYL